MNFGCKGMKYFAKIFLFVSKNIKKNHFLKYGIGCESYNKATCLTKCNYPNKNNWEFTWQFEGKVLYLQRLYDTMKRKHVEPK